MTVKIKHKNEDVTRIEKQEQENTEFDTRLDAVKFTSQVHSRIKRDINSDFVMAILSEKDKEGIVEMTSNAYFVKRIIEQISENLIRHKKRLIESEQEKLGNTIKRINTTARTIFDTYMIRIYMTVLLNRNVSKNHILKLLAGTNEEEEEEIDKTQAKGVISGILEKLKKKPE